MKEPHRTDVLTSLQVSPLLAFQLLHPTTAIEVLKKLGGGGCEEMTQVPQFLSGVRSLALWAIIHPSPLGGTGE